MGKGLEKAAAFFDIPAETLPDVLKLTVTGGRSICVENHRAIRSFSPDLIEVDCGRQLLHIRGSELRIERLSRSEIRIIGQFIYAELD